jgi:hypothetical protein
VKGAAVGGPVTEEDHAHLAAPAHFDGKAGPDHDGKAASHDTVGAENAPGKIRDVHGAAFAFAIAGCLAEQLSEHELWITALGQYVGVTAVG